MALSPITEIIDAIAAGEIVILVDDEDRENEGDFIVAAEKATPEQMAFIINHSSGYVCVPMLGSDLDRLDLPLMVRDNQDSFRTAYTVSVDAAEGVSTGISAADRARTINLLADADTEPTDLVRPGHVIPLRYKPGGVLRRPGHTEASVDLAMLAGLRGAAAICEVVNPDGSMARLDDLIVFAEEHGLKIGTIESLVEHRRENEDLVERVADAALPTDHGDWRMVGYRTRIDGSEQVALVHGDVEGREDVLVRMHSECLTGDVFGSQRCDCGAQLDVAMRRIREEGAGVIVYLRGHEGRGIGLLHKLRAYELQDGGADTVEANEQLGLPIDDRDYGIGALILADLGLSTIRLMTNNPEKKAALGGFGLSVVERMPLEIRATDANAFYLETKRDRLGHLLTGDGETVLLDDDHTGVAFAPRDDSNVVRFPGLELGTHLRPEPRDGEEPVGPGMPRPPLRSAPAADGTPGPSDTDVRDEETHFSGPRA